MNILDENIDLIRRRELLRWKIHVRQIGIEIGYAGMKDRNEIIPHPPPSDLFDERR